MLRVCRYEKFEKKLNELGSEMETIAERLGKDKGLARREKECVGAFLIFEYAESKERCLQDYSWTNVRQWCRYPKPLLFQNRRLTVRPAPDPEDVWVSPKAARETARQAGRQACRPCGQTARGSQRRASPSGASDPTRVVRPALCS